MLARELDLGEIAAIRGALPPDVVVEYFIHGALCVAFSGQCYISHAQTGRSANRGDCSQSCRLPYTLKDEGGRVVAFEKHLLSLKDNNQSANLRALIDAGVRSFKIEGRYKEAPYVKNITGHYRRELDRILEERPELAPPVQRPHAPRLCARPGQDLPSRQHGLFRPRPASRHRRLRHTGIRRQRARNRRTAIGPRLAGDRDRQALANGDGLTYLHKREVHGLQANRAECQGEAGSGWRWRIWPNEPHRRPARPACRPDASAAIATMPGTRC